MQKSLLFFLFLWLHFSSSSSTGKEGEKKKNNGNVRLFVFGDSYADTGNWNKSIASAWKVPYGMTYPGKPAGRFSDGRILTDYIASYLQIKSPIPYEEWNLLSGSKKTKKVGFGMNFAYGGTGVFNTDISRPNMTTQIDILEHLINQSQVYLDNSSSIAFVSVGGNDYSNFLKHPTNLSIPEFTNSMINQLVVNLERIHGFGVQKIAITLLEPIGCLPTVTSYSGYTNCTQTMNEVASYHNMLLQEKVDLLNNKTKDDDTFITLDLYSAFMSYLQPGNPENVDRLEQCCKGVTSDYDCGSIEANVTKYTICEKLDKAFFWDKVHLTQNGWYQVYMAIKPTLARILNSN